MLPLPAQFTDELDRAVVEFARDRKAVPVSLNYCGFPLLLKSTRGVTIAVVSSRERKRRQPGLATDDPAFVGWHQLVRGIQGS